MNQFWKTVECNRSDALDALDAESRDVIVVSTRFDRQAKLMPSPPLGGQLSSSSIHLLAECARVLKPGGLLFVYGLPRDLAFWGQHLFFMDDTSGKSALEGERPLNRERHPPLLDGASWKMIFKYWIALDIDDAPRGDFLKPAHQGLLLFTKSSATKTARFQLNTSAVRIPHGHCVACGLNLKDWGGKKHLMNPKGAALSDVWRDLPRRTIRDALIPADVLTRIRDLTRVDGGSYLHVIHGQPAIAEAAHSPLVADHKSDSHFDKVTEIEPNQVYQGDCVSFLHRVTKLHPGGLFDLAFADPPYNLQKLYSNYEDALAEQHYIEWCNDWLDGVARALKPGGSLFVLNLPKWAIHHATFLSQRLGFRHWIAWDALSDPRGKLMPAHYALLWFSKAGAKPRFNYAPLGEAPADGEVVVPPDSPKYCLRTACIKSRKRRGNDEKVELTDVWFDVHRIKHKRDRDAHPCQLPEKLMERIILLTTNRGDLVFDPFCGAGTTAIVAMRLGRQFVVVDCDANYVHITNEKLVAMKRNADLFGHLAVPRKTVNKPKPLGSKRAIELYLQNLAQRLGRTLTEADIQADNPEILRQIDLVYPTRGAALKRCKVALSGVSTTE
jgi:site-specific DNA-methyltransferase (adenine-specific)